MTSKSLHMARKNFIFAQKWNRFSDFKLCTVLQEACEGTLMCNELIDKYFLGFGNTKTIFSTRSFFVIFFLYQIF